MICKKSFDVVNAAHAYCVIGCCSRSNGVQTHRWRQNLFSLCCSTWRVVFRKCLRDYFGLSQWRSRKKLSRSCLHVRNTEKPTQKSSWRLEPSGGNLHNSCIVWHSQFGKCLHDYSGSLSKWRPWNAPGSGKTIYKEDKKETKKQRRNVAFVTWKIPKLAQILQKSSGCDSGKFFFLLLFFLFFFNGFYATNRFHFAVRLVSNRSQMTLFSLGWGHQWPRTSDRRDTSSTFLFLPILTSFVSYWWKDARQHEIYCPRMSIKIRYISQLSYIFSVSLMAKFLRESFHYIQLSAERCSVKTCCELPAEKPRIDILSLKNFGEVFIKIEELYMAFLALMHDKTN